jgi:predicted lipoprotein with Yx(FWY)xxD motif
MLPRGRGYTLLAALAALTMTAACGGSSSPSAAANTPAPAPTKAPNVLAMAEPVAGQSMTILVDDKGLTLYRWGKDSGASIGKINCVGGCAAVWPPFVLPASATTPVAGSGVTGTLTTLVNPEGKGTQVLYNGWPLYYFAKDKAPGDTTGQGVNGNWFVVTPDQAPNA